MLVGGRAEWLMERNQRHAVLASLVGAGLFFHVAFGFAATTLAVYLEAHRQRPAAVLNSEVEIEARPPPPPPAPPPPPEAPRPPEPEPEPEHRPPPRPVAHNDPPPPPPAPAPTRAAPLMVVEQEFSNDSQETVATGDNVHATGDVSSDGVMRDHGVTGARQGGTVNGTGTAPAPPPQATPPPPDFSVRAHYECDEDGARQEFPDEAREAGIMNMTVRVRVIVDASGRVQRVVPLTNPGFGFTAAAERVVRHWCQFTAARDHAGNAVSDTIQAFPVNFQPE